MLKSSAVPKIEPVPAVPSVRLAVDADVARINELFHTVFGERRDDDFTRWRLFESPTDPAIVTVAESDGEIVGHYALWTMPLRLGSEVVTAAQSIDSMVHPAFRRRGLIGQLAIRAMKEAERRGVEVLFSFPNPESLRHSVRRLNWSYLGEVATLSRPLRAASIMRAPRTVRPVMSLALMAWPLADTSPFVAAPGVPGDDELMSLLGRQPVPRDRCQPERTPRWYRWRFAPEGRRNHHWIRVRHDDALAGVAVWGYSAGSASAFLSEVVADTPAARNAAVAFAVNAARAAGFSSIETLASGAEHLAPLAANGFRRTGALPLKVRALTARVLDASIYQLENWRLFGADFDLY